MSKQSPKQTLDVAGIIMPSAKEFVTLGKSKNKNESLTTWGDLSEGGVSKSAVFEMYRKRFGENPKEIFLNENICEKYHHYCNNSCGKATFFDANEKLLQTIGSSRTLINDSDVDVTYDVTLSASKAKSASVTVTTTSGFSFDQSISVGAESLGLGSEFSSSFTFENSVGSTDSTSESVTVTDSLHLTLPPK